MRNIVLFLLITVLFFSCTIEKRRYFKGYHVENGRMGEWGNGRVGEWGNGEERKRESAQEQQSAGIDNEKSQTGDIILEGDTAHVNEALKFQQSDILIAADIEMADEMVIVEEKIITDYNTNAENGLPEEKLIQPQLELKIKSAKGGDVVDVGRVIFGMLSIVSFAIALLFFGSAIFAIDSLVMTVLLLIGGGFALAGLVFLVIFALIKRGQSASGYIVGQTHELEPAKPEAKPVRNALIPFVIFGLLALLFGLKMGAGKQVFLEFLESFLAFVGYAFLAVVFLIITIVRIVRKRKQSRLSNDPVTPTN